MSTYPSSPTYYPQLAAWLYLCVCDVSAVDKRKKRHEIGTPPLLQGARRINACQPSSPSFSFSFLPSPASPTCPPSFCFRNRWVNCCVCCVPNGLIGTSSFLSFLFHLFSFTTKSHPSRCPHLPPLQEIPHPVWSTTLQKDNFKLWFSA